MGTSLDSGRRSWTTLIAKPDPTSMGSLFFIEPPNDVDAPFLSQRHVHERRL